MEINVFGMVEQENFINPDISSRIAKSEEYKKYIDTHIKNVAKSYNNFIQNDWLNNPHNRDIKELLPALRERIINHDASKYSDAEFEAFRAYLYPINDEEKEEAREEFEIATTHHYKVNEHHPEHWKNEEGKPVDMPLLAILELICDWDAMSYNTGGSSSLDFWKNTKESRWSKVMTQNTIDTIERLLKLMYYKEN